MSKSPDAFRTIREVADWLGVAAHVLRFWESKFTQIKPGETAGGRRYYRPADMELVGGIKVLLHDRGMTVRGVQRMLREEGVARSPSCRPRSMPSRCRPNWSRASPTRPPGTTTPGPRKQPSPPARSAPRNRTGRDGAACARAAPPVPVEDAAPERETEPEPAPEPEPESPRPRPNRNSRRSAEAASPACAPQTRAGNRRSGPRPARGLRCRRPRTSPTTTAPACAQRSTRSSA
jgi:DNA-binding transcriptional MerR regulator